jgi:pimeloyl-ACP methyl ester carboxylesterase
MRIVETPVLEIALEDEGPADGEPLLLLHGWPDAPRGWSSVASRLHAHGWRTLAPALRGSGATRFRETTAIRDGRSVALLADAVELLDALALDRIPIVGHDWGARVAYQLAALQPERVSAIVTLSLPYQPRGAFEIPTFEQSRAFWYQWLMCIDAGARAVAADRVAFARLQWDTWSPSGWFDDDEFRATAESFANPDWVAITLSAYRSRFLDDEPRDPRYEPIARHLAETEAIAIPTLMIQGAEDRCDEPSQSAGQEQLFTDGYRRVVLDGVGHFPHREAPDDVALAIVEHLTRNQGTHQCA